MRHVHAGQIEFPAFTLVLEEGEHYAGMMFGKNGSPSYHLILLPGDEDCKIPWEVAVDRAEKIGGELPTRREQSLLFANLSEQFNPACYWSCDQHASERSAWALCFSEGSQGWYDTRTKLCVRAIRRVPVEDEK